MTTNENVYSGEEGDKCPDCGHIIDENNNCPCTLTTAPKAPLWKNVIGYEGLYEVSECGNVRSLTLRGRVRNAPLHMKQQINWKGYLRVSLSKDGISRAFSVHQLVMAAFVGPVPDGCNIDHKDGVKTNNHLSNLQYIKDRLNTAKYYEGKCNLVGTYRDRRRKARPWNAKIITDGKTNHLGRFETQEEAHMAYKNAFNAHMEGKNVR